MKFEKSISILFSRNIGESIKYYKEVLGFEHSWEWGDPTDFGGIVKDDVELFFCLNGQGSPGTWMAIVVEDVDSYYEMIKEKARISCPHLKAKNGICERCWSRIRMDTSFDSVIGLSVTRPGL